MEAALQRRIKRGAIVFDPEQRLTRSSFAAECDINRIVDTYARTGMVNHVARATPQYGEAPETDFFEAACMQAEIRSKAEEGAFEGLSEAPEGEISDSEGSDETPEIPPEDAPQDAAPDESSGTV